MRFVASFRSFLLTLLAMFSRRALAFAELQGADQRRVRLHGRGLSARRA